MVEFALRLPGSSAGVDGGASRMPRTATTSETYPAAQPGGSILNDGVLPYEFVDETPQRLSLPRPRCDLGAAALLMIKSVSLKLQGLTYFKHLIGYEIVASDFGHLVYARATHRPEVGRNA